MLCDVIFFASFICDNPGCDVTYNAIHLLARLDFKVGFLTSSIHLLHYTLGGNLSYYTISHY